jgi:hypothetical protein
MAANTQPEITALQQVQLRSALDAQFRARLLADPRAVLAEAGVEVPDAVDVEVRESTQDTFVLALPPTTEELTAAELDGISAGWKWKGWFPVPDVHHVPARPGLDRAPWMDRIAPIRGDLHS